MDEFELYQIKKKHTPDNVLSYTLTFCVSIFMYVCKYVNHSVVF